MSKPPFGSKYSNRAENGKLFKNINFVGQPKRKGSFCGMLKWAWNRKRHGYPRKPTGGYKAFGERWYHPCNMAAVLESAREAERAKGEAPADRVFWIGHSSAMLCVHNGANILFDPIFSHRASPVSFAGPARRFPPAVTVENLPHIDVVTVSHNHYDHLDKTAICAIYKRFPDVRFVVPLEMGTLLKPWGIPASSITSLDWWEETRVNDVVIALTAAQHYGLHSLFDYNKVLWGGWCVGWKPPETPNDSPSTAPTQPVDAASHSDSEAEALATDWNALKTYYFTGDTAFNEDVFTEIHKHYPRIDFAALPIGAYQPREMMENAHVDPPETVKIFQILNVKRAFGVHWGTFELADESMEDSPVAVREALKAAGLSEDAIITIPMGEHIDF